LEWETRKKELTPSITARISKPMTAFFRGVEIPGKTVDTFFKPVSRNNCLNAVESYNGRVHAVILVKG